MSPLLASAGTRHARGTRTSIQAKYPYTKRYLGKKKLLFLLSPDLGTGHKLLDCQSMQNHLGSNRNGNTVIPVEVFLPGRDLTVVRGRQGRVSDP